MKIVALCVVSVIIIFPLCILYFNHHIGHPETLRLNEIPVDDKGMEKNIHNTWNVLIMVSYGFMDMVENWWLQFSKLKLHMRVVLIVEDSATYQLYRQNTNIIVFNGLNVLNTNSAVT